MHEVMGVNRERMSPRASTLEVLEKMLGLASQLKIVLPDIAVSAISLYMEGNSINKVASQLGTTHSNAEELISRGLYELRKLDDALTAIVDENKKLKEENALLADENELMRQTIAEPEPDVVIRRKRLKKKAEEGLISEKQLESLSLSIYQLGFNSRLCSALRVRDFYTLGDIVKCSRSSFLRFRNVGAKSMAEIDKAVADAGLTYDFKI